jgi:hypothetical protein
MKRSSSRRARRWVNQELIRRRDKLSDTAASVDLSGDGSFNAGSEKSSFSES